MWLSSCLACDFVAQDCKKTNNIEKLKTIKNFISEASIKKQMNGNGIIDFKDHGNLASLNFLDLK